VNSVWTTLIWAVVTLVIAGALIQRFGRPLVDLIRAHQENVEASRLRQEAAALELQNQAEVEERTLDERTRLRKAELVKKTAEIEAETKAVEATAADRVEAERQVLAARTLRRVQAAQEGPVNQSASPETMAALVDGYQVFIRIWGSTMRFDNWIGSAEWTKVDPGTMVPLIAAYKASCQSHNSPTSFMAWVGKMEARDGLLVIAPKPS
jgi:hypothetical protein